MDNGFTIEQFIAASPERVFDAWISPKSLGIWMVDIEVTEIQATCDAKVGGAFQINMIGADRTIEHTGTYKTIDRPSLLEFTWISPYTKNTPTLVSIRLTPMNNGTQLSLTHTLLPDEYREAHRNGWGSFVQSLATHFQKGSL